MVSSNGVVNDDFACSAEFLLSDFFLFEFDNRQSNSKKNIQTAAAVARA